MAKRTTTAGAMGVEGPRRRRADGSYSSSTSSLDGGSVMSRMVNSVFDFVRFAEFEILFVLFFLVAFLLFKDLTSRPEYNQILVKKPAGTDWWPY